MCLSGRLQRCDAAGARNASAKLPTRHGGSSRFRSSFSEHDGHVKSAVAVAVAVAVAEEGEVALPHAGVSNAICACNP